MADAPLPPETRLAIVTGASRGIGRAVAERLARDGTAVVVDYRADAGAAAETVDAVHRAGARALAVPADVTSPDAPAVLFDAAERHFGRPADILVCNAGVARFGALADLSDADYDLVFDTNTRSAFRLFREASRRLPDGGRIVLMSSGAAVSRRAGSGIYAASKAAADALMQSLAKELGPRGITVNSVLPGAVRTEALAARGRPEVLERILADTPLGRLGEPGDIAEVVAFLTSDAARWLTGQTLHASGGEF
ncbi:SDR family oxidoreductase [Phaeacidiphilus oryzae]|uniref:SDR family oxidoreductase n=1 Tax=Phaeacidiphilus oryzae TaxID=348818 RepID=UPI00055CA89A|nr:SDR family oxidoreductase [Phaeacidiphilus oryzae]